MKRGWERGVGLAMGVVGALLLLGAVGNYALAEYKGEELRTRLEQTAPQVLPGTGGEVRVLTESGTKPNYILPTGTPGPNQRLRAQETATGTGTPPAVSPVAVERVTDAPARQNLASLEEWSPLPIPTLAPTVSPMPTSIPIVLPVHISIPELGVDARVTEMGWVVKDGQSEWLLPADAAGHHQDSAGLGVPGNVVISGHNNIEGRVFLNISQAWPDNRKKLVAPRTYSTDLLNGRAVLLTGSDGKMYRYQITSFYRLEDSGVPLAQREVNASYMQPTPTALLTLITCWPPWSNTHRVIVQARPVTGS